ncbi:hypothetical protein NSE_0069 [Neorickettsia sennetsu str. Miyayama]|uniref:Uncharacterized protein n=1 Tax=Ehrlichia sennetsu (strain ATCC VR-367 / Miyayama) TaxID=222891 RepID=Q2GEX6_EHRS3|nr:hypothetical protein NSE_0069 [Neorickettsia sennetsu str. Miyayama]
MFVTPNPEGYESSHTKKFSGWVIRTASVFLFLSSAAILAVQIAKRIPWMDDGIVTKSWWCFVYLQ